MQINKYADPVQEAREDLTVEEAIEVARQDPSLLHAEVSDEEIEALRQEAAQDGDESQVDLCDRALGNFSTVGQALTAPDARKLCAKAILYAAMEAVR